MLTTATLLESRRDLRYLVEMSELVKTVSDRNILPYRDPTLPLRTASDDGHFTDVVTEIDLRCGQEYLEALKDRYPGSYCEDPKPPCFEERCEHPEFWICDPLDDTSGFTRRLFDGVAVHAALLRRDEMQRYKSVAGVLYLPFRGVLYCAQEGVGVFRLKDQRSETVQPPSLSSSLRVHFRAVDWDPDLTEVYEHIAKELEFSEWQPNAGGGAGASFADLLESKSDLIVFPRDNSKDWDIAMAAPMIRHFGGFICDFDGNELDTFNRPDPLNRNGYISSIHLPKEKVLAIVKRYPGLLKNVAT